LAESRTPARKRNPPAEKKASEASKAQQVTRGSAAKKPAKKASSKPKKTTKKQLAYEAAERRRKLSSVSKVWGDSNAEGMCANRFDEERALIVCLQLAMDLRSRRQQSQQLPPSRVPAMLTRLVWLYYFMLKWLWYYTILTRMLKFSGNADKDMPSTHAMEGIFFNIYADWGIIRWLVCAICEANGDAVDDDDSRSSDGSVSAYEYSPSDEEEDDCNNEHEIVQDGGDIDSEDETAADDSVGQFTPLPVESSLPPNGSDFDVVEPSDPNLVLSDTEDRIESDGEGSEKSVCVQDDSDDEDDAWEDTPNEAVADEASRVARLLSDAELEGLHMRVEGMFCTGRYG